PVLSQRVAYRRRYERRTGWGGGRASCPLGRAGPIAAQQPAVALDTRRRYPQPVRGTGADAADNRYRRPADADQLRRRSRPSARGYGCRGVEVVGGTLPGPEQPRASVRFRVPPARDLPRGGHVPRGGPR